MSTGWSNEVFKKAEAGDHEAQWIVGTYFHYGDGVDVDYNKAKYWYECSMKQGNLSAMRFLSELYFETGGYTSSNKQAINLLTEAAKKGEPGAQFMMYELVMKGEVFQKDLDVADDWLFKSVENDYPQANYEFGKVCLSIGVKTKDNSYMNLAVKKLTSAANQQNLDALYTLGRMYFNGKIIDKNYNLAFKYMEEAASLGIPAFQFEIGAMYYQIGDIEKAIKYFNLTKDEINEAAYNLGIIYRYNTKYMNKKEAVKYFKQAAKAGMADAQYEYGRCYLEGIIDGYNNFTTANHWFKKAAKQGHLEAKKSVENLKGLV